MELTITLTDKEIMFLQKITAELNNYQRKQISLEVLFMSVSEWPIMKNQRRHNKKRPAFLQTVNFIWWRGVDLNH